MYKKRIGKHGEDVAVRYLKRKGYKIVERNFSCRLGEIDIIARNAGDIVFVEVRSGSNRRICDPSESIGNKKIRRLHILALEWLRTHPFEERGIRFEAVCIIFENGETGINHIEDIFME